MPKRRALRILPMAILLACVSWAAGFLWFVHYAASPSDAPPDADGIVALTGGADRVEQALALLQNGHARLLLISGVARQTDLAEIARRTGIDAASMADRITLGRHALSTYGNGIEAAEWAQRHHLQSLIVVTAAYHMPRALTEIGRALPGVALYPAAVLPRPREGTNDSGTLGMLAGEYTKWLAASAGLGFLSRGHNGV